MWQIVTWDADATSGVEPCGARIEVFRLVPRSRTALRRTRHAMLGTDRAPSAVTDEQVPGLLVV
jgi:hypothetical protein